MPVLELLLRCEPPLEPHEVGALVVLPTRELGRQVADVFEAISAGRVRVALMVGGADVHAEAERFVQHGGNVLVGTPGRLNDAMARLRMMVVRRLEVLVLDEADRLLDMGFEPVLGAILARLPKQRRTGLFSATQTEEVRALVRAGLRNPVYVRVRVAGAESRREQRTPSTLTNYYAVCESATKLHRLCTFLLRHRADKLMVYFLTCACVDYFARALARLPATRALRIVSLHGRMPPERRVAVLRAFADAGDAVLLCTDVAARGLDLPGVDWVVQYDAPQNPDAFVHRCGRTARLGRSGNALLFLHPHEDAYVQLLSVRKVPVQPAPESLLGADDASAADALLATLRGLILHDRMLYTKSVLAFVSYVRAYKEHLCSLIFRFADLDLAQLARGFALLRMPRMPELRTCASAAAFVPCATAAQVQAIPYATKSLERQRFVPSGRRRASVRPTPCRV